MKLPSLVLCLVSLLAVPAVGQDQEDLVPDSLLNWLRIIETKGFKLIYASDDDGRFTAISVDSDGDLLIAHHTEKTNDKPVGGAKSGEEWSMHIVDVKSGQDLWDDQVKKQSPESARVTYTRTNGIFTSSITNAYPRGFLYPLKPYEGRQVRYEVYRHVNGVKETRLSYVLTLPDRKLKR